MKYILLTIIAASSVLSCGPMRDTRMNGITAEPSVISANQGGMGTTFSIEVRPGNSFYYPLMAFWIEDMEGNYIQTLYVARSVATGVFRYGESGGKGWKEAPKRAPQTLPYWAHKRGVRASDGLFMPEPDNPVPDAYTGATPTTGFILNVKSDGPLPAGYRVMMEINQNWDWNQYWHNNRFPGDENYAMSAQPALVYEAVIDGNSGNQPVRMMPSGHSHWSGLTGELFTDLTTLSTALDIVAAVEVRIRR